MINRVKRTAALVLSMALFLVLSASNPAWSDSTFPIPWNQDRVSIYHFIKEKTSSRSGSSPYESAELPDEELIRKTQGLYYVPGALDGIASHHGNPGQQTDVAAHVLYLLKRVLRSPSAPNLDEFYDVIRANSAIGYIDPFLQQLFQDREINHEHLGTLMFWLVAKAPDREAVKLAIGVLGFYESPDLKNMLTTLGQHDEFTLYAVVAITNSISDPEQEIWALAKSVHGWGRIHAVERLSSTTNPEIKSWLLREGFRNNIMNEYLAYIAAEKGDLLQALRRETNDRSLLTATGDILHALITGGPAEDIHSYPDGAEVAELYLEQSVKVDLSIGDLLNLLTVRDFVSQSEYKWDQVPGDWKPERLARIRQLAATVVARESWPATIRTALKSDNESLFHQAHAVALSMEIDPWEIVYERQRSEINKSYWWQLMQTSEVARVSRVVALATTSLPLDQIATGPSDSLGLGEEYAAHSALDSIVQALSRFPGQGWALIKTALKSPVIRNRYLAINALAEWPRATWPGDAEEALRIAEQEEPDAEVKKALRELTGAPL